MIGLVYNTFEKLPLMQYKIIEQLMLNNEDLFKMLKYNENNCLDRPNLTLEEKSALIYPGDIDSSNYRIFLDFFTDDSFTEQCSLLRIYPYFISPPNRVISDITFCIEFLSHNKITQLNNYTNRNVYAFQQIIETINGTDVSGVGLLSFDRTGNPRDSAVLNLNSRNYQGYSIYISTHTSTTIRS